MAKKQVKAATKGLKARAKLPRERWALAPANLIPVRAGQKPYGFRANRGAKPPSFFGSQDALLPVQTLQEAYQVLVKPARLTFNVKAGPTEGQRRTLYGSPEYIRKQQQRYGGVIDFPEIGKPVLVLTGAVRSAFEAPFKPGKWED